MSRLKAPPSSLQAAPSAFGQPDRKATERARDKLRRANTSVSLRHLYNTARWRCLEKALRSRIIAPDMMTCQDYRILLTGKHPAPNVLGVNSHRAA